jgi:predicted site-specific integrase-resolvase
MARWIKLETWAQNEYGDDKPDVRTLRRWAANGNLYPPAEQHGKCWYVKPETKYCSASTGSTLDRMRAYYGAATA